MLSVSWHRAYFRQSHWPGIGIPIGHTGATPKASCIAFDLVGKRQALNFQLLLRLKRPLHWRSAKFGSQVRGQATKLK